MYQVEEYTRVRSSICKKNLDLKNLFYSPVKLTLNTFVLVGTQKRGQAPCFRCASVQDCV